MRTIKQGEQDSGSSPDFPSFPPDRIDTHLASPVKNFFRRDKTNDREKVVVGDCGKFPEV